MSSTTTSTQLSFNYHLLIILLLWMKSKTIWLSSLPKNSQELFFWLYHKVIFDRFRVVTVPWQLYLIVHGWSDPVTTLPITVGSVLSCRISLHSRVDPVRRQLFKNCYLLVLSRVNFLKLLFVGPVPCQLFKTVICWSCPVTTL